MTETKARVLTDAEWKRELQMALMFCDAPNEATGRDRAKEAVDAIRADRATLREAICGLNPDEWEVHADMAWEAGMGDSARLFRRLAQVRRELGEEGDGGE